jgi:SAM-dependent methyltransferase
MSAALDIQELYDHEPHLYDRLASGRDFSAEVSAIRRLSGRSSTQEEAQQERVLELFAGPAWHSIRWKDEFGAKVLAVDSSPGMGGLAVGQGRLDCDEYIVGRIPSVLAKRDHRLALRNFDFVLILRYSLGYLSEDELEELIRTTSRLTKFGGRIVFELHDPRMLASNLEDFPVSERRFSMQDGSSLSCAWPSGPIRWLQPSRLVEMPVSIEHVTTNGTLRELRYVSREFVYQLDDIQRMSEQVPNLRVEHWSTSSFNCFKHSQLVSLIRTEDGRARHL